MPSKAQRFVVIGEFFLLSFLSLKKPSHRIFLHAAHHILHSKYLAGCRASAGEFLGQLCCWHLEADPLHLEAGHTINGGVFNNGREYHVDIGQCPCLQKCMSSACCIFFPIWPFFCRYSQLNYTHRTNDIATTAEEAQSLIRAASHAACDDVTEGLNRHKRAAQNQNVDARSSWVAAPSQPAMGLTRAIHTIHECRSPVSACK